MIVSTPLTLRGRSRPGKIEGAQRYEVTCILKFGGFGFGGRIERVKAGREGGTGGMGVISPPPP